MKPGAAAAPERRKNVEASALSTHTRSTQHVSLLFPSRRQVHARLPRLAAAAFSAARAKGPTLWQEEEAVILRRCQRQFREMVVRALRRAAAASATTAALVLLAPTAVVSFVANPGASSLWPAASPDGARFCSLNGCTARGPPASSSSRSRVALTREHGGRSRGRSGRGRGVASLRAEVLPEGGVSPCIIKVGLLAVCM